MKKLFLSILIVFLTTSFMSLVGCSDNKKVDYQLQEQCGKRSEELFKTRYGVLDSVGVKTVTGFDVYTHSNHFNKKLNKCFQIVEVSSCKNIGQVVSNNKELLDINENKKYGEILEFPNQHKIFHCYVEQSKCKSIDQWNSLVKPYMEE